MAKKVIDFFYSEQCSPCKQVSDLIKEGRFASDLGEGTAVNLVEITSDEGFARIEPEGLEKVPSAKHEGKFCQIHIDEERNAVMFTCHEEAQKTEEVTPEIPPTE